MYEGLKWRLLETRSKNSIEAHLNPFSNNKFLDSSNLKEFADDNFKIDENGRKVSKRVENTVGKGEVAR